MKFIHFIDANSSKKVLNEGLSLKPNRRKINLDSSGIFCYPLIKIPFKTPVLEKEYNDDIQDYLALKKQEELLNNSLSIEEAWEVVGASRVTRRNPKVEKVSGAIFEIDQNHWPLTVFINIRYSISNEFAEILENNPNEGIHFKGHENSLLKLIKSIRSKRYVLSSTPFAVNTEEDLIDLIDKLILAGGGIWGQDSFECMLIEKVSGKNIEKIIELENRYYRSLAK